MFLRRLSIKGRFPFVRLLQFWDNPRSIFVWVKRNVYYKRVNKDFSSYYSDFDFLSPSETLDELLNNKSIARFGDGEFDQLVGFGEYPADSDWSQKNSKKLIEKMINVLSSKEDKLIVAITPSWYFLANKNAALGEPFDYNMWVHTKRFLYKYLNKNQQYGDCRLFVPFSSPDLDWDKLRGFLSQKIVIVATGNVNSLRDIKLGKQTYFVECGKVDAFERLEMIKTDVLNKIKVEQINKEELLVLASLGPTAGILALEFLKENIVVWDSGHIFKHAIKR